MLGEKLAFARLAICLGVLFTVEQADLKLGSGFGRGTGWRRGHRQVV
jgi:hypothetical protein